jgi:hypothetical protein
MNDLVFDKETHTYTLDGKPLISVTQLMEKHGLSPNYNGVDEDTLKASAERGTLIHKEIENYIKKGEIGFTEECAQFVSYVRENNIAIKGSEVTFHNDIVAGTTDLIIKEGDQYAFADIKTTSTLHKDSVAWQLSLYAYISGMPSKDYGYAFHFSKDGLKVVKIALKPISEVGALLECERKGEIYHQELIVEGYELAELYEAEQIIIKAKEEQKRAEERKEEVYNAILKAMEEQGVKTYETDTMKITYVAPTKRITLDTKKLKEENPLVAKAYERETETKASLRVTLKGE